MRATFPLRLVLAKRLLSPALLVTGSLLLAGCGSTPKEQELAVPMAEDTRPLTEVEVANLPSGVSLAEVERMFGRGEPQSGNRIAYQAVKQPGKYFWFYPYDSPSGVLIHHVVLGDRMEENGQVMWPMKWRDMSPASAAYVLDKMQRP